MKHAHCNNCMCSHTYVSTCVSIYASSLAPGVSWSRFSWWCLSSFYFLGLCSFRKTGYSPEHVHLTATDQDIMAHGQLAMPSVSVSVIVAAGLGIKVTYAKLIFKSPPHMLIRMPALHFAASMGVIPVLRCCGAHVAVAGRGLGFG